MIGKAAGGPKAAMAGGLLGMALSGKKKPKQRYGDGTVVDGGMS